MNDWYSLVVTSPFNPSKTMSLYSAASAELRLMENRHNTRPMSVSVTMRFVRISRCRIFLRISRGIMGVENSSCVFFVLPAELPEVHQLNFTIWLLADHNLQPVCAHTAI